MSVHIKHIAANLHDLGDQIKDAIKHGGHRAHFVLLAWADGTIQSISNTSREDLLAVFRHHIHTLETDTLRLGLAGGGH